MDTDLLFDGEDLVYHLTKEYQSSLLDDADASPSEILADVASFLAAPISPVLSNQSSPNESSSSDSGSEDDFRIKFENSSSPEQQSLQSPFDWLSSFENEPTNILKPDEVDSFLQKTAPVSTSTDISANEPIPNARLPQRTGPVMAIENGVIKGIKLGYKNNDEEVLKTNQNLLQDSSSTGNNLHKSYFDVVNENIQPSNIKSKDGNKVHLVLEQKKVPTILKRTTNVLFNEPQKFVIPAESTNGAKIAIVPVSKSHNDIKARSYQVQPSPPHSIILSPKIESPEHSVTSPHSNVTLSLENIIGPIIDCSEFTDAEKRAIKKQQRMIKNRETACRSRQKKKEHLATLEQKLLEAEKEIARLQQENKTLREQLQNSGRMRKIPRLNTSFIVPKKNIAVIFAMVFMVSLNWNFIGWNSKPFVGPTNSHHGSRHLLWTEDTNDISPPDHDKFQNSSSDSTDCRNATLNASSYVHINQTESIRIAGDLNRWIGSGKTLNWTNSSKKKQSILENNSEEKNGGGFPETYNLFSKLNFDNFEVPTLTKNQGKNVKEKSRLRRLRRSISVEKDIDFPDGNMFHESIYSKPIRQPFNDFDIDDLSEWNDLLRALHRRDDTFYVVGVGKGEHLLLPAVSHNITRPPKMALILPARSGNDSQMNDHVTLMQIDCSVVNTTLVKLKSDALPESIRKSGHDFKVNNDGSHKIDNNINNKNVVEPDIPRISRRIKSNESNEMFPHRRQQKQNNIDLNKKDLFAPYMIAKVEQSKKLVHEN